MNIGDKIYIYSKGLRHYKGLRRIKAIDPIGQTIHFDEPFADISVEDHILDHYFTPIGDVLREILYDFHLGVGARAGAYYVQPVKGEYYLQPFRWYDFAFVARYNWKHDFWEFHVLCKGRAELQVGE